MPDDVPNDSSTFQVYVGVMVMPSIVWAPVADAVGVYVKVKSAALAGAQKTMERAAAARREKQGFMGGLRRVKKREWAKSKEKYFIDRLQLQSKSINKTLNEVLITCR